MADGAFLTAIEALFDNAVDHAFDMALFLACEWPIMSADS